jgi:nicotinamide-nucleotide amidase
MKFELICIGDELLSGRTQDKNGHCLASFLENQGLKLNRITTISDDISEICDALTSAFSRSSVVILSGGLGPTKDDLTKAALATFFKVKLIEDLNAKRIAEKNYRRKGLKFIKESTFYHLIPQGFISCDNPKGLAPGLIKIDKSKTLLAAPGVPWEFSTMVEKVFFPLLNKSMGNNRKKFGKITIRTQGIPEENIFFKLVPNLWDELSHFGKVASLPTVLGVDIVVSNIDKSKFPRFQNQIKKIVQKSPLNSFIWQFGEISLEEAIIHMARKKNLMIGAAESASGGLISHRLTNIPGCADNYMGSIVAYSNNSKIKNLRVKPSTLKKFGSVSKEVAREMAIGAQNALAADLTVSVTGFAGPAAGEKNKPVGLVCIGWAKGKNSGAESFNFKGDRATLKSIFTQKSLFLLLKKLTD